MRSSIFIVSILGIFATISVSAVEGSNLESLRSRNWSIPVLRLYRRPSVDNIFNHEIHTSGVSNILRDSQLRGFVKLADRKRATFSDDSKRIERSGDASGGSNHSRIDEKTTSGPKESTLGSSSSVIQSARSSESTIVTSQNETKSPISMSTTPSKNIENEKSPIVTLPRDKKNPAPIPADALTKKVRIPDAPIVTSPKETKTSESTIGTFSQETGSPRSSNASSSVGTKSSEFPLVYSEMKVQFAKKAVNKSVNEERLKNVVLLLIDDSATGEGNYLRHFDSAEKFPVRGFLENCQSQELPEVVKFSLGGSLVSGKTDADCECDRVLRAKIGTLLSWARHSMEMTIGTVTTMNFSVPLSLGYESPLNVLIKNFEDNDETSGYPQEVPRSKSGKSDALRSIDSENKVFYRKRSVSLTSATPNIEVIPKQEDVNGFDGMWNVFDMFSRIRMAFFRALFESLSKMASTEDEFSGKRPISVQPSLVELVTETLKEFKLVPNESGFVLVIAAPENELPDAIDILQREFTTNDTLFVISGMCSPTNDPIPFVAHGPGVQSLGEVHTIWELPLIIKRTIIASCSISGCKNKRPERPVALPSLELQSSPEKPPRDRIQGPATNSSANETTSIANNPTTLPGNETEDGNATMPIPNDSGAYHLRP